jgi:hypothetical protein
MKKGRTATGIGLALAAALALATVPAGATPSTTYWTPMTVDIQPYGVWHTGVDNYFTVLRKAGDGGGAFPTDVGFTIGVLPFEKLKMEIGVDLLESSDYPLFFNAKLGVPEGAFFPWQPTLHVGVFNVGTRSGVTAQNVVFGVIGKTIPGIGRLSIGPYLGNGKVLVDKDGEEANSGLMFAFDRGFWPTKDAGGNEYNRIVLAADYATGKNSIGGGGAGIYYFFTKDISLLTGPVLFNEEAINGTWKWTMQLDINSTLF